MPVPNSTSTISYCNSLDDEPAIKIGVKLQIPGVTDAAPQFIELSKRSGLMTVISELCTQWGLADPPENFALKYEGGYFVTEGNRSHGIKTGSVLVLTPTPAKTVEDLMEKLKLYGGFAEFEELSPDPSFIYEVLKVKGQIIIVGLLLDNLMSKECLASLLNGIHVMMTKEREWWEDDPELFSKDVIVKINSHLTTNFVGSAEEKVVISGLKVLHTLIPVRYEQVFSSVSVAEILKFLKVDNLPIQRLSVAVINALFEHGDQNGRRAIKKEMETEKARQVIVECIINNPEKHSKEMNHELYILQTLLLNQLKDRMYTAVQSQDQKALEKIKELRKRAFNANTVDTPSTQPRTHRYNLDYKKLGFRNDVDPTQDFRETPPGTLALDLMYSFCNNHVEQFRKLVLENSCRGDEHDCPFAVASIELVKLIVDVIRIGKPASIDQDLYYPMFFTHDNPLEEFFSICILHLNKTWKEMRATTEDFHKVMDVTREQITSGLNHAPATLDEFQRHLKSYNEIQELWKEEAKLRGEREGKAVQELKRVLLPDVLDLVQRQRLNFISEGTKFSKYKEKGRYVFVKLSPNHKTLCHGEWSDENGSIPSSVDDLESKIQISELKDLLTGSDVQFIPTSSSSSSRNKNRENVENFAFSILTESGYSLDLIAPSQKSFDYWTDAINALLRRPMTSTESKRDIESLLTMEIKLKLLDVEGLDIPEDPPEIPPSPPDYDFGQDMKVVCSS